jgi:hypothetical protein
MLYVVLQAVPSDPRPSANDVVAGRAGAVVFVFLILAVVFLCWSFSKQLKKVRAARDAGVYGSDESEAQAPGPRADDTERNSTTS